MDEDTNKVHSSKLSTLKIKAATAYYSLDQTSRTRFLAGLVAVLVFLVYISAGESGSSAAVSSAYNSPDDGFDFGEEEPKHERAKPKVRGKKQYGQEEKKPAVVTPSKSSRSVVVNPVETFVSATKYTEVLSPMEVQGKLITCPDYNDNKGNKRCGKGFAEYQFNTKGKPGKYALYIQTLAKNIRDNSLWVSPPLSEQGTSLGQVPAHDDYVKCAKGKPGSLVPHKHVSKGKHLCCPKYLAQNEAKGQNPYYSMCCIQTLGGGLAVKGDAGGSDEGCMFDLEVGEEPVWNLVPRPYNVDGSSNLSVRVYMREDGTAVTGLYLSTSTKKSPGSLV